jgi:hypothetical protein
MGSGAPRGNKNALKFGLYTREAIEERKRLRNLMQQSRKLIMRLGDPVGRHARVDAEQNAVIADGQESSEG